MTVIPVVNGHGIGSACYHRDRNRALDRRDNRNRRLYHHCCTEWQEYNYTGHYSR